MFEPFFWTSSTVAAVAAILAYRASWEDRPASVTRAQSRSKDPRAFKLRSIAYAP
jgi:hypothetical protein